MTPRDRLRRIAHRARAIPNRYGLRPYTVSVVVTTWPGANTGRGTESRVATPITEAGGAPPKVRELNAEELALNNMGSGSVRVGPITPSFPGGGTDISVIKPLLTAGQTVHLLLEGPGFPARGYYEIKDVQTDHGLHWTIIASPVQSASAP